MLGESPQYSYFGTKCPRGFFISKHSEITSLPSHQKPFSPTRASARGPHEPYDWEKYERTRGVERVGVWRKHR